MTLGQLHRAPGWVWLYCNHCDHSRPVAIVPFIIRWGPGASTDRLRESAVCSACGGRGAAIRLPSWGDKVSGWQAWVG